MAAWHVRSRWAAGFAVAVLAAGCASTGQGQAGAQQATLSVSEAVTVLPGGALNPTTAVDPASGAVYLAWAQEVEGGGDAEEPLLEAVVARSDDGGATFGDPVVVSAPGERVASYTVSPTQVVVGPDGEVYLLYLRGTDHPLYEYGRSFLHLARSDDGAETFGAPVVVADEATEGVETSMEMANLFVAPDGDVYVTFLDFRGEFARLAAEAAAPPATEEAHSHEEESAPTQLRIARSTDGGVTFAPSSLVSEPTCECCGTAAAQGADGPVFATTRSSWTELKDSYEPVRDVFVAASADEGATWGDPVKVHDDNFKISGCPDITSGLAVDSQGRLHTAWYTGTESGPGVYYAFSDDQGATFSEPVALLSDEWIPYGDVKLVLDGSDNVWVAFEDRREEVELIQVARVAQGTVEWSDAWPGTAPSMAVTGDSAIVTWATVGDQPAEHGETSGIQALLVSAS
ncbi:MAG: sialidase family protein [Egibacteraceae bacterium]